MTSWAPGAALRMAPRTRPSMPCTASGCEAMYSSTDFKSVLAITDSSLLARLQDFIGDEGAAEHYGLSHGECGYAWAEIGRAACRARVEISVGDRPREQQNSH